LTVFAAIFVPEPLVEAVSDDAWLAAMLETERALAVAEAATGVIPADAAAEIAGACRAGELDVAELARAGRATGNPAEPLVRALRQRVGGDAARWVHHGATSQDVMDTASMLVARSARELVLAELDAVANACAFLADAHRATPLAARTLMQQAVPTTFGLKAAGWLVAVVDARIRLAAVPLKAQLGGAAGTLAALGDRGPDVLRAFAVEVGLEEPVLPWHTRRVRVAELADALAAAAAACDKIALDVVLLAQTEVGEVSEAAGGGSSTMPQKRNATRAAVARACARRVHAAAGVLTDGEYEHERAAGAWHAEWGALSDALALAGGAAAAVRECLDGLEVHVDRMRENMTPALVAERVAFALAESLGREDAHRCAGEAFASGDPRAALASHFDAVELDALLDPATYVGSADAFVDRALALHRSST
jgi:3-carboxy-cis,cis-muconate cycloisomerase